MPLILAIEPDRRQASQLTAMVRGRLRAELVLGESAERALAALGPRVPDLILTSALLSPRDESALADRLRTLGGGAAHVQTLTIPVLASTSGRGASRAGGVLSALRRDKGKTAVHDGCDPAVFAEQCKEYLERAEAERAAIADKAVAEAMDAPVKPADVLSNTVHPPSGRESTKPKADHQSFISRKESIEPVPVYSWPAAEQTDPYVATAQEVMTAPVVEEPAPESWFKRKGQRTAKRAKTDGVRSVLGLSHDESDGPASLLAAVAALEAEEHVEPIIAAIAEPTPTYEPPIVTPPIVDAPSATTRASDLIASFRTAFETSVARPPVAEPPVMGPPAVEPKPEPTMEPPEELLELSSLLDAVQSVPDRYSSISSEDPVVDVYELDNSLLTTSLDDAVRPLTTGLDSFATPPAVPSDAPKMAGPSWPVLNTVSSETAQFQPVVGPNPPAPSETIGPVLPPSINPAPARSDAPLSDILEALRRDAAQVPLVAPAAAMPASPIFSTPDPTPKPEAASLSDIDLTLPEKPSVDEAAEDSGDKKKKRTKTSPAQDEWGFFDPDQCGFAALIEKLEEITDNDDKPTPRRA